MSKKQVGNNPARMNHTAHLIPATQIPCYWFEQNEDVSRHVARIIANTIRERNSFGHDAVLGLPEYYAMEAFVRWEGKISS